MDILLNQLPALDGYLDAAERAALVCDDAYWKRLCPKMHVGSFELRKRLIGSMIDPEPDVSTAAIQTRTVDLQPELRHSFRIANISQLVDELRDRMSRDGYWDLPAGAARADNGKPVLDWVANVADMAEAMRLLTEAGWPPSFLLMYDEPWAMAHQLKHMILLTSGNRVIFDFAMFHVGSKRTPRGEADCADGASSRGWEPHRDRGSDETVGAFRADGTPQYCTSWVALTDATPYSSCLMCVPKRHDPGYSGGDGGRNPMEAIMRESGSAALQYIRALPAAAGTLVTFSHRLLHWGSAADEVARLWKGEAPRMALSFACADPRFEPPFLSDAAAQSPLPALSTRAGLVAGLALFYVANEDPGQWRLRLYWDCFRASMSEGSFSDKFATIVAENFRACEARWAVGFPTGRQAAADFLAAAAEVPEAPAAFEAPTACALAVVPETSVASANSEEWGWSRGALERFGSRTAITWVDAAATPARAVSASYQTLVGCASSVAVLISRLAPPILPSDRADAAAASPIGLCLDNGLCFVTCMLGALWSGHPFLPLAIDLEAIRMQMHGLLEHVKLLFCAPELAAAVEAIVARCAHRVVVCLIDDDDLLHPRTARHCMAPAPPSAQPPPPPWAARPIARSHERVCTFHTSGTTGKPKPVHSSHAEWAAFVKAAAVAYHLVADSRVFVATSHIFDPSAGLTFAALALGASVCLSRWAHTLRALSAAVELTRATHACSTPSVWELYDVGESAALDAPGAAGGSTAAAPVPVTLQTVMLGGEPMPATLVRRWLKLGVRLINTYGTTETNDLPKLSP